MGEKSYTVEGIVLRARDYKDTDKIVTLFSFERGKLILLAKGARKTSGSLRGAVQLFGQGSFLVAIGRSSLDIITQGRQEQGFPALSMDLTKIAYASYVVELTEAALAEGRPAPDLYPYLLAALSLLALGDQPERAARFYELKLLQELGAMPMLDSCQSCGRSLQGGAFYLDPAAGGVVCASCAPREDLLISPGAVLTLQRLATTELGRLTALNWSKTIGREMARALFHYLDYHLDYIPKSRSFLMDSRE
ncbi:MAG: DNA repair protein RecO [Clostridiales bacterium]